MSPYFNKLPGHKKTPSGIERKILRLTPRVFLCGLAGIASISIFARVFPVSGSLGDVLRWIQMVDIYVISISVFYCTAIFTIALGAFIVMVMKGPAYVADAYPLVDSDRPKR